ncbi:MAG: hypothetical protein LBK59_05450, partial [Bifidobacteriaceae bacterium]|nr:hypothetical protein [Bifidobacteriaceae bacterium]
MMLSIRRAPPQHTATSLRRWALRPLAALATVALLPALTVVGSPSLAAADGPRNLAYHRAVVQSSAVDYDHTGHAVTDGIYTDYGPGTGTDSGRTEPAFSS